MALLFMDGFDHSGVVSDPVIFGKWGSGNAPLASAALSRTGINSCRFTSTIQDMVTKAYTTSGGVVVGFAFQINNTSAAAQDLLQVREGTTVHLALVVNASGLVVLKRGVTTLATGTTVLALNTWYYLELKAVIDDTIGTYEVHIDNVQEVALTATGQDTKNGGTGVWDRIRLAGMVATTYVDDFYLCDTSGSAPRNTFLGMVKVEALMPQTDAVAAGSNAGLTCSTGTDHGALVDEIPPNTTDYNSSATIGLKDTYNYPAMTLTGTIYGIQTNMYVAKSDTSARQVCAVVRAGGTDYDGANINPATTFFYNTEIRAQNPNTGPAEWLVADIATIQVGMKITT